MPVKMLVSQETMGWLGPSVASPQFLRHNWGLATLDPSHPECGSNSLTVP